MSDNDTNAADRGSECKDQLGPVAEVKCGRLQWAIPHDDYRLPLRFLNNDTHPLYDKAALDAAVAAERERIIMALPGGHSVDPQWVADMVRGLRA